VFHVQFTNKARLILTLFLSLLFHTVRLTPTAITLLFPLAIVCHNEFNIFRNSPVTHFALRGKFFVPESKTLDMSEKSNNWLNWLTGGNHQSCKTVSRWEVSA
jgi:hypothetical protein